MIEKRLCGYAAKVLYKGLPPSSLEKAWAARACALERSLAAFRGARGSGTLCKGTVE